MAEAEHPRGRAIRLLQPIGRGGFGTVFLAEVRSTEGLVQRLAVKLLHERWAADSDIAARARDEARLMSQLNHDNVVRIHGLTRIDGRSAVLMEYVEGVDAGTLAMAGESGAGLPVRVVAQVGEQVASALDAAWHSLSPVSGEPMHVVHRDIKPANVLVSAGGAVKVMDFGIARAEVEREAHTESAQFGTGRYMAPERWLYGEAGAESDLFSLGVTLWELTLARPMERLPLERVAFEGAVAERLAALDDVLGEDAPRLARILEGMLAFEPHERATASQIVQSLSALADEVSGPDLRRYARQEVPELRDRRLETMATDPDVEGLTGTVYTGIARESNDTFAGLYLADETSAAPRGGDAQLLALGTEAFEAAQQEGGRAPLPSPDPKRTPRWAPVALLLVLGVGLGAWWLSRDTGQQTPTVEFAAAEIQVALPPDVAPDPGPTAEPETLPRSPAPRPIAPAPPAETRAAEPEPKAEPEPQLIEAPVQPATEPDAVTGHEPHLVVIDERPAVVEAVLAKPESLAQTTVKILADPREGTLRLGDHTVRVGDSLTIPVGVYTARFEGPDWRTTCQVELSQSTTKLKFEQKGDRCRPQ